MSRQPRSRPRRALPYVVVALAVLATALIAAPGGRDDGPEGTLALRRFLAATGRTVRAGDTLPARGTFVLFSDLREPEQARPILDWVREGGRLVISDPRSAIAEMLGVVPGAEAPSGRLAPGCVVPEIRGVRAVVANAPVGIVGPAPEVISCFRRDLGALMVVRDLGSGRAIVFAGVSPFQNQHLRREDNAALALGTIPEGDVVFGPPLPSGAFAPRRGVWASLPLAAKVALIEITLALVLFAVSRARRLGRPVLEEPIAPIPAGELVHATARLYRNADAAAFAAGELRRAIIGRFARRAGVRVGSAQEAAALLARAGAGSEQELAGVLAGPEPRTDVELIAHARTLEEIRRRVEGTKA